MDRPSVRDVSMHLVSHRDRNMHLKVVKKSEKKKGEEKWEKERRKKKRKDKVRET